VRQRQPTTATADQAENKLDTTHIQSVGMRDEAAFSTYDGVNALA